MSGALSSLGIFIAVLLSSVLVGCQAPGPTNPGDYPAPQAHVFSCYRSSGAISVDGKLDEPAWYKAEVISQFYQPGSLKPPSDGAEVRLLWDNDFLYIGARLRDKDVYAMVQGHDGKTWDDDVFEVFIKPSEEKLAYYEFHMTPKGATLDLMFPRRGAGSHQRFLPYTSGMRAAATVQGTLNDWQDVDEGWTAEMAIPLKALGLEVVPPKAGATIRFAICRYNYSVYLPAGGVGDEALEYSSSARLPVLKYHLYEYYDLLRFEPTTSKPEGKK